jgi:hypothetical protein
MRQVDENLDHQRHAKQRQRGVERNDAIREIGWKEVEPLARRLN